MCSLLGCVAAGRLAAANPGLEILVIEQGPTNLNDLTVITPALMLTHLAPDSKHAYVLRPGVRRLEG